MEKKDKYGVPFIDFLFTLALWVGIVPEKSFSNSKGIFSENWIINGTVPQVVDIANLLAFFLCALVMVLSWLGYHRSVGDRPHKDGQWYGMGRFIVDTLLLFLYTILVMKFKSLEIILFLLPIIFSLYLLWDILQAFEYKEKYITRKITYRSLIRIFRRECVTGVWFLAFIFLYKVYDIVIAYEIFTNKPLVDLLFAAIGIVFVITYRLNKAFPIWEKYFEVKSDDAVSMKIYIAGPYTAKNESEMENNSNKAIDAGIEVYKKGHIPFIPHLTHWVDRRCKANNILFEYEDYMRWDIQWLKACDAIIYLGSSKGADQELKIAEDLGKQVFRSLNEVPSTCDKINEEKNNYGI